MFTSKLVLCVGFAAAMSASPAFAQSPRLGKPLSENDVKTWDISILPDGTNLPQGTGNSRQGAKIYAEQCAMCHGDKLQGGASPGATALIGGPPLTNGIETQKTIANYYAYATTIFDYIRRGMPFTAPGSLTNEEVYSLTAFILAQNKLIGENETMDSKTLPAVKMPNRDNFILPYPDRI